MRVMLNRSRDLKIRLAMSVLAPAARHPAMLMRVRGVTPVHLALISSIQQTSPACKASYCKHGTKGCSACFSFAAVTQQDACTLVAGNTHNTGEMVIDCGFRKTALALGSQSVHKLLEALLQLQRLDMA